MSVSNSSIHSLKIWWVIHAMTFLQYHIGIAMAFVKPCGFLHFLIMNGVLHSLPSIFAQRDTVSCTLLCFPLVQSSPFCVCASLKATAGKTVQFHCCCKCLSLCNFQRCPRNACLIMLPYYDTVRRGTFTSNLPVRHPVAVKPISTWFEALVFKKQCQVPRFCN